MNKIQAIFKRTPFNLQTILVILTFAAATFAAGEVDPTFNAAVQSTGSTVQKIVVQSDGKFLVAGMFNAANKSARAGIARFNNDGTVDETFVPPDFYKRSNCGGPNLSNVVLYAIAVQSDGKIIVGGYFDQVGTIRREGAVRLNADGSLDLSFNPKFFLTSDPCGLSDQTVYDIVVQPDNKIVFGGIFQIVEGSTTRARFVRVNADGSLDTSFADTNLVNPVRTMALQPDGKIVFATLRVGGTDGNLQRVNSDGTPDNSFLPVPVSSVSKVALQPDGRILVAGQVNKGIARYNSNGVLDSSFNPGGTGAAGSVRDIVVLPDGKILIGGDFATYNNVSRLRIARLNGDGTPDTTFNYTSGGIYIINALALTSDGSYLTGGIPTLFFSSLVNKLVRITAAGTRDTNFSGDVYLRASVYRVFGQTDGKVLISGRFNTVNGIARFTIARLNADGNLDTTFNANLDGFTNTVVAQPDGKVLTGGSFGQANGVSRPAIARFNVDGTLDTSFVAALGVPVTSFRIVNEIIPLPNGKILVAGRFRLPNYNFDLNVARLNADGSTDTSFVQTQVNVVGEVRAMKLQPDGKIVVSGTFSQIAGASRGNIARLNADGTIDTTFNPSSGTNSIVNDFAIQSNGNITIGGDFTAVNGVSNRFYLAQLFPDGRLNAAFITAVNNFVFAVERQSDDKILVGSYFNINGKRGIARFNPDGSLDSSFVGEGTNDIVRDIFIQSDDKILIGGEFTRVNNTSRISVARLLNAATVRRTPYDFDGDGRADISVFRPSNGVWYLQQSTAGFTGVAFGQAGDVIAPADYDGDGKTDVAVFRPSNGVWYIQRSQLGFLGISFGASTDIPAPADYNGDGRAELAVFRPSTGVWYTSTDPAINFGAIQFGQAGDKPVAADYDGDGKTDLAVFRPSNGVWYIQRSQLGFTAISFGASDDALVPADYDGDGRAEVAVFRPSTGVWYTSTNPQINYGAVVFGANGDVPVPADYDGDGKTDIAVFRPSNGVWYLLRSAQGFTGVLFGVSQDKPIPNAFVR